MSFTDERFSRLSCGIERLPAPTRVVRGFWMNFRQVPVHFVHVQTWKSTCQLKQVNALRGKFSLQSMEVNMVIMHSTVSISWKYGVHKCIFFISLLREGDMSQTFDAVLRGLCVIEITHIFKWVSTLPSNIRSNQELWIFWCKRNAIRSHRENESLFHFCPFWIWQRAFSKSWPSATEATFVRLLVSGKCELAYGISQFCSSAFSYIERLLTQ